MRRVTRQILAGCAVALALAACNKKAADEQADALKAKQFVAREPLRVVDAGATDDSPSAVLQDRDTGCQYVVWYGHIAPRLDATGKPVCHDPKEVTS